MHASTHDYLVTYRTAKGQVKTYTIVSFYDQAGALQRFIALRPGITIMECHEDPRTINR